MFNFSVLKQFSKLALCSATSVAFNIRSISTTSLLSLKITNPLCAEPLKKKKKMDPAIIKAREDRRRKRLEKQIRRLEKNAQQLKPIDELEVPLHLLDQMSKRKRPLVKMTTEQIEARALLEKEWSQYKRRQFMDNIAQVDRIMSAQKRALNQLLEESEELYDEAITPDFQLIPYTISGPVSTPPIKNYDSPDGEYIDISKKWDQ